MSHTNMLPYTIPAGGVIANLLANTTDEFFGGAAVLTLYGSADAAGDTFGLTSFGTPEPQKLAVEPSPIMVASAAGQLRTNENFIGQYAIRAGHRLQLQVTGAVGHIGRFQLVVD